MECTEKLKNSSTCDYDERQKLEKDSCTRVMVQFRLSHVSVREIPFLLLLKVVEAHPCFLPAFSDSKHCLVGRTVCTVET